MAVSRAMRRLLRVLHIQEEQSRTALESAVAQLRRLEQAQTANDERGRSGRHLVTASALHGRLCANWLTVSPALKRLWPHRAPRLCSLLTRLRLRSVSPSAEKSFWRGASSAARLRRW